MPFAKTMTTVLLAAVLAVPLSGADEIHEAIKKGDLAAVKEILAARPASVGALDERGYTPLHVAAREGRVEIASVLIEKGALLEAKDPGGFTPLFLATLGKKADTVLFLLDKGADPNAETRFQTTPLFTAAESGDPEVVRLLTGKGAEVNHVSPIFGSPLHRAAYMDFPEVAKTLLDAGADLSVTDQRGQTPLHQAAQLGRVTIARLFVERGADLNALDRGRKTPLHWAIRYGTDRSGANNSSELGFLLMGKGARVDRADADGETPLLAAVKQGYTDLAGAILRRGGDLRACEPKTGRTLLHLAALRGYGDMAELLLARGVDASARDSAGRTAFDYAREHGNPTVAMRLASSTRETGEVEWGARFLAKTLAGGEAFVWSLNLRGCVVKTRSHLFIFDNEEMGRKPDWPSLSNGWISAAEIMNQDIVALYSSYHAEPGSMEFIHGLEDVLGRVVYVNYKEDRWRGGQKTLYVRGRETQMIGRAEVIPYETVDEGGMGSLGYLIRVDGLTIFYPNFFPEDIDAFRKEVDVLAEKTGSCDLAIVEVTPGRENDCAAYLVEKLKPKVVIPYDRSGDAASGDELAKELARKHPGLQFGYFRDPGDRLHYKQGRLDPDARVP
jgi:ankyrin repeat protein